MFGFLKKKIKQAISSFTKKVEDKAEEESTPEDQVEYELNKKKQERKKKEAKPKKKEVKEKPKKVEEKKEKPEPKKVEKKKPEPKPPKTKTKKLQPESKPQPEPEPEPEPKPEPEPEPEPKKPEPEPEPKIEKLEEKPVRKGIFGAIREKLTKTKINTSQFEDIFYEMEIAMIESNVAIEVIEKIKADLEKELVDQPIPRTRIEETIRNALKKSVSELFTAESFNLIDKINEKKDKPFVICFVGVNGSGKTTTIAKTAKLLLNNNMTPVLAASDTFRAAAIDQLQTHADNLGLKLIKHEYGSDAAAVAFDAIAHAKSKGREAVLVDTAGRMHSNVNLMDEMKKIIRVAKPDLILFIGESITGNDCVEQARSFNDAVGIDGIILSKADIDEKGGAAVSVSFITGKPIIYIGTGQEYADLKPFDPNVVIEGMGI